MSEVKMSDYASQSDKSRVERSSLVENSSLSKKPEEKQHERKIEPVAKNAIVKQKKHSRLKEAFFGEHVDNVKDYIIYDVMIPALKGTLEEMFGQGLHMLFFGESKKKSQNGKVAFGSYYKNSSPNRLEPQRQSSDIRSVDDILFDSERTANEVLDSLLAYADDYGSASVLDFYDAAGVSAGSHVDDNYGWFPRDIRSARIRRVYDKRDIYYVIDLPRPIRIV